MYTIDLHHFTRVANFYEAVRMLFATGMRNVFNFTFYIKWLYMHFGRKSMIAENVITDVVSRSKIE